jgi:hypothetical protein
MTHLTKPLTISGERNNMGIFDTTAIVDIIAKSIDELGTKQANAIIEGFERAAHIIAEKLEEIEKGKK